MANAGVNGQGDEDQATVAARMDELNDKLTDFSESEVELLEEAGLILTPEILG